MRHQLTLSLQLFCYLLSAPTSQCLISSAHGMQPFRRRSTSESSFMGRHRSRTSTRTNTQDLGGDEDFLLRQDESLLDEEQRSTRFLLELRDTIGAEVRQLARIVLREGLPPGRTVAMFRSSPPPRPKMDADAEAGTTRFPGEELANMELLEDPARGAHDMEQIIQEDRAAEDMDADGAGSDHDLRTRTTVVTEQLGNVFTLLEAMGDEFTKRRTRRMAQIRNFAEHYGLHELLVGDFLFGQRWGFRVPSSRGGSGGAGSAPPGPRDDTGEQGAGLFTIHDVFPDLVEQAAWALGCLLGGNLTEQQEFVQSEWGRQFLALGMRRLLVTKKIDRKGDVEGAERPGEKKLQTSSTTVRTSSGNFGTALSHWLTRPANRSLYAFYQNRRLFFAFSALLRGGDRAIIDRCEDFLLAAYRSLGADVGELRQAAGIGDHLPIISTTGSSSPEDFGDPAPNDLLLVQAKILHLLTTLNDLFATTSADGASIKNQHPPHYLTTIVARGDAVALARLVDLQSERDTLTTQHHTPTAATETESESSSQSFRSLTQQCYRSFQKLAPAAFPRKMEDAQRVVVLDGSGGGGAPWWGEGSVWSAKRAAGAEEEL